MIAAVQGGVRPAKQHGSRVTYISEPRAAAAGLIQSDDLSVGLAWGAGIALSDDFAIPHHYGTDGRIRGGDAKGAPSQRDTVLHVVRGGEGWTGQEVQPLWSPEEPGLKSTWILLAVGWVWP